MNAMYNVGVFLYAFGYMVKKSYLAGYHHEPVPAEGSNFGRMVMENLEDDLFIW